MILAPYMKLSWIIGVALACTTIMAGNLQEIGLKDINGKTTSLKAYEGKVLLEVNVASKCGLTPQYKAL